MGPWLSMSCSSLAPGLTHRSSWQLVYINWICWAILASGVQVLYWSCFIEFLLVFLSSTFLLHVLKNSLCCIWSKAFQLFSLCETLRLLVRRHLVSGLIECFDWFRLWWGLRLVVWSCFFRSLCLQGFERDREGSLSPVFGMGVSLCALCGQVQPRGFGKDGQTPVPASKLPRGALVDQMANPRQSIQVLLTVDSP